MEHPSDGATGTEPPIQRSGQFDAVFEQFKGYVDSRFHELSTTSASNTESSKSRSETKKLRREAEASKLKNQGNFKQFLFNAELLDKVRPREGLLLVTEVSTTSAEAIFRVKW